eukprot:m.226118 g.226118  ORF g.226118 m.226118 type:complete len:124 (-) comp15164_c0_seq3:758-1129(-)
MAHTNTKALACPMQPGNEWVSQVQMIGNWWVETRYEIVCIDIRWMSTHHDYIIIIIIIYFATMKESRQLADELQKQHWVVPLDLVHQYHGLHLVDPDPQLLLLRQQYAEMLCVCPLLAFVVLL